MGASENSLENLRSILEDLLSDEFGEKLSAGPINGFIDINELYQMFMDSYDVVSVDTTACRQVVSEVALQSLEVVRRSLWSLVLLSDLGASDREIVASSAWDATRACARKASDLLPRMSC
jgi:hypothetical protein